MLAMLLGALYIACINKYLILLVENVITSFPKPFTL